MHFKFDYLVKESEATLFFKNWWPRKNVILSLLSWPNPHIKQLPSEWDDMSMWDTFQQIPVQTASSFTVLAIPSMLEWPICNAAIARKSWQRPETHVISSSIAIHVLVLTAFSFHQLRHRRHTFGHRSNDHIKRLHIFWSSWIKSLPSTMMAARTMPR